MEIQRDTHTHAYCLGNLEFARVNPVIGFKFESTAKKSQRRFPQRKKDKECPKEKLREYIKRVTDILLCSQNLQYSGIVSGDDARTVKIPTTVNDKVVSAVDFNLSGETSAKLFENGHSAASAFLENWCFNKWLFEHRY